MMKKKQTLPTWGWALFMSMFLLVPIDTQAQGYIGPAARFARPLRLNLLRPQALSPNSQKPPYEWSATYLRNAFGTGQNLPAYQLDSTICANGVAGTELFDDKVKAYYAYNNDGQLTEIRFTRKQPDGSYKNFSRKQYQYQDGRRTLYRYQLWDDAGSTWEDEYEEQSSYNAWGLLESFITREKDASNQWAFLEKEETAYDTLSRTIEVTRYEWAGNNWGPKNRQQGIYNPNGEYLRLFLQAWNGASWDTLYRETAIYDSTNTVWLRYLLEAKDMQSGTFEGVARELYFYDLRGFWIGTLREERDSLSQQWQRVFRENYQYTPRGVWTNWTRQAWKNGSWENAMRQEYVPAATLGADVYQSWDSANAVWVDRFRNYTRFDGNGNLIGEVGTQYWDTTSSDWKNTVMTQRYLHAWSEVQATSIAPGLPDLLCLLPNPYRIHTPVYCKAMEQGKTYDVRLHDLQGRTVINQTVRGGEEFSLDRSLPMGIYQLTIYERGQLMHTQKLLFNP